MVWHKVKILNNHTPWPTFLVVYEGGQDCRSYLSATGFVMLDKRRAVCLLVKGLPESGTKKFLTQGDYLGFKKGGLLDQKKKRLCLGLFLATKSRFPSFSPLPRSKNRPV